ALRLCRNNFRLYLGAFRLLSRRTLRTAAASAINATPSAAFCKGQLHRTEGCSHSGGRGSRKLGRYLLSTRRTRIAGTDTGEGHFENRLAITSGEIGLPFFSSKVRAASWPESKRGVFLAMTPTGVEHKMPQCGNGESGRHRPIRRHGS